MDGIQQRVLYRGRVQGVGFRYTTASIARRHPVKGYVRNLPDGSVELVVDGERDAVPRFLDEIGEAFEGNITDRTVEDWSGGEVFTGFEIRH